MFIPKTPDNFDYDLWTTEEGGIKHYWARVKKTGETTEVSHEVMLFLRREEKKMRREVERAIKSGSILSLDVCADLEEKCEPAWLSDGGSGEEAMLTRMKAEMFITILTPCQREVFENCIILRKGVREYAREKGLNPVTVLDMREAIAKKAKKYF